MMEEFNLKEKRKRLLNYLYDQFGKDSLIPKDIMGFVEDTDKEFIRRLKEGLKNYGKDKQFKEKIDKLSGGL